MSIFIQQFSRGFSKNQLPQHPVPYIITITHSFSPATHTVLNGVLGSCSKFRSQTSQGGISSQNHQAFQK